jgi:hypothetical protein
MLLKPVSSRQHSLHKDWFFAGGACALRPWLGWSMYAALAAGTTACARSALVVAVVAALIPSRCNGGVLLHTTAACPLPAVHGVRCQQNMHQTVCLYIQVLHVSAMFLGHTVVHQGWVMCSSVAGCWRRCRLAARRRIPTQLRVAQQLLLVHSTALLMRMFGLVSPAVGIAWRCKQRTQMAQACERGWVRGVNLAR